jgi:cell wall-associated NlpC family hydrolase
LDRLESELGELAEQYNIAQIQVATANERLTEVRKSHKTSTQLLAEARDRLRKAAVTAYTDGRTAARADALLRGNTDELALRRQYLDAAAARDREAVDEYRAAASDARDKEAELVATERNARLAADLVEARQADLERTTTEQRATLAQVQGNIARLVAEEDAAREEQERQRAAELLKKQQAQQVAGSSSASSSQSQSQSQSMSRSASRAKTSSASTVRTSRSTSAATTNVRSTSASTTRATSTPSSQNKSTTTTTASTAATAVTTTSLAPTSSPTATGDASATPTPAAGSSAAGLLAVEEAKRHLGKPYQWAGVGPDSFDCSGLTMVAWRAAGVSLSHSTTMQWRETTHIDVADLRAGDLVFFGSSLHHVGLYVGDGMMIEAPSSGKVVRYRSIGRSDFAGATRPG